MVLTAEELGIKDKRLQPFFCCDCGNRMGWTRMEFSEEQAQVYCEDCSKNQVEDDSESEE